MVAMFTCSVIFGHFSFAYRKVVVAFHLFASPAAAFDWWFILIKHKYGTSVLSGIGRYP